MTPLSDIKSLTFPGEVVGGVLLEPDGLHFWNDARITVTHPDGQVKGLLFSGSHDGVGLEFMATEAGEMISAPVRHFSSVVRVNYHRHDDPKMDNFAKQAAAQLKALTEEAKKMMKQPLEIPTPPSISLECITKRLQSDVALSKQLEDYIKALGEPEYELISKLLEARSTYLICTGQAETHFGAMEYAQDLASRLLKKIENLVKKYSPQHEKFLAVLHAFHRYNWEVGMLGVKMEDLLPIDLLYSWANKIMEQCLEKVEKHHDFRYLGSVLHASRYMDLIMPDPTINRLENVSAEFERILQFKLTYQLIYNDKNETIIRIEGEGDMRFTDISMPFMSGIGTGEHVSVTNTFGDPGTRYEIEPKTFPLRLRLRLEPCEDVPQAVLLMDRLGAQEETHVNINSDGVRYPFTLPIPIIEGTAGSMFERTITLFPDENETELAYIFHSPLRNGQQTFFTQTITEEFKSAKITLFLQIEHTPQPARR